MSFFCSFHGTKLSRNTRVIQCDGSSLTNRKFLDLSAVRWQSRTKSAPNQLVTYTSEAGCFDTFIHLKLKLSGNEPSFSKGQLRNLTPAWSNVGGSMIVLVITASRWGMAVVEFSRAHHKGQVKQTKEHLTVQDFCDWGDTTWIKFDDCAYFYATQWWPNRA